MVGRWRPLLALALLGGLYLLGRQSGAAAYLSLERLRALCAETGPAGALLFVGAFAAGELLHVPGIVFVLAGVLGYGRLWGGLLSYAAAICSVTVSFAVIRGVGGQPLGAMERPLLRRALARLDARPVRTVALLRLLLFLAPPLNTALALSPIRLRHYLLGSALGLLVPIAAVTLLADWVARLLG